MSTAMAHASGLPTIKCSDCGRAIEISQIADHVCAPAQEPQKPMDRFISAFSSMRASDKPSHTPFKSRPTPADINTSVANRPFLQPGLPTPNSGSKSPFRFPPRNGPSPALRNRSPSPDIPLSQECAFPAFPTPQSPALSSPAFPKRAYTDGQVTERETNSRNESRSENRPWGRRATTNSSSNSPARPYSPYVSAQNGNRPFESTRNDSFAGTRLRYDAQSEIEIPPVPSFPETRSESPTISLRMPFGSPNREDPPSGPSSPGLSIEEQTSLPPPPPPGPVRRQPSQGSIHFRKPSVSAAIRPLHEIGSMKSHRSTASRGGSPDKLDPPGFGVPRAGSAQSMRSDRRLFDAPPVPGMSAQFEGFDIPRSQSAVGNRLDRKLSNESQPPLPLQNKASDFDIASNPYHTPTESTSSNGSAKQTNSSTSSPPTSTASFEPSRKRSDTGEARLLDSFGMDIPVPAPLHISVPSVPPPSSSPVSAPVNSNGHGQFQHTPVTPAPISAPAVNNPQPFQQPRRRTARSFSRPNAYEPQTQYHNLPPPPQPPQQHKAPSPHPPAIQQQKLQPSPSFNQPIRSPQSVDPPESPMDPAMQNGRLPVPNSYDRFGPPSPAAKSPQSAPLYNRNPTIPDLPPSPGFLPNRPSPTHRPKRSVTTGHKGNCRGCGELIKGKSVSSADGRLTGRWHKQCFVCKTCNEPFQTTDFYVLGNYPYCARHYHELNRSMCNKCDRGIEGHYVETDRRMKFHPHCFTCQDCHLILRDTYFENANGKILCDQHAFKSTHLGPGRRFPEKRSTRLMMMA